MAQELLYTFSEELEKVALAPEHQVSGTFRVEVGKELIWCRKRDGGFPDVKTLKQLIRDKISPHRRLGHLDRESNP
jgi:selenoprotein W-related protein